MAQRVIRFSELASSPNKAGILPVRRATDLRRVWEEKFPKPSELGDAFSVYAIERANAVLTQGAKDAP